MVAVLDLPRQKEYLEIHIPYRLASLKMCCSVCELLMKPVPENHMRIEVNGDVILDKGIRAWCNPVVESGLLYSRVLLEFLGIKLNRETFHLYQRKSSEKRNGNDVWLTDFGLQFLTVGQAIDARPYATSPDIQNALEVSIQNAHKAVAHLTMGPNLPATCSTLRLTCRVVLDLVRENLYKPKGIACPIAPIEDKLHDGGISLGKIAGITAPSTTSI